MKLSNKLRSAIIYVVFWFCVGAAAGAIIAVLFLNYGWG